MVSVSSIIYRLSVIDTIILNHTDFQENATESEKRFDSNYFLQLGGKSNSELRDAIEEKKTMLKVHQQEFGEKKKELRKSVEEKNQLHKKVLEERLFFDVLTEGNKKVNEKLILLQDQYNKIVDPYNENRRAIIQNKDRYQAVAKRYNDRNKKIEEHKDNLHKKGKNQISCIHI